MPDEETMLAAYALSYPDATDRLMLADWLEERGDVRGSWLRDADLAAVMGPTLADPIPHLVADVVRDDARRMLLLVGTPAVPALLAELARGNRESRDALLEILGQLGDRSAELTEAIERLKSVDPREQRAALNALASLGDHAAPAVTAILERREDDRGEIRTAAVATLGRLGSFAANALLAARRGHIHFQDARTNQAWQRAVVALGSNSPAIDWLVVDLGEGWGLDPSAATCLRELGPDVLEAVLRVGAKFLSEYASVRVPLFEFLQGMLEARERLLAAARDRDREGAVRAFAVMALVPPNESPAADGLLSHLLELAADPVDRVAAEAAGCLGRIGAAAADVVPLLVELLGRENRSIAATVIDALARLGPTAATALTVVSDIASSGDNRAGRSARRFLRAFCDPAQLEGAIRRGLQSPNPEVRVTSWRWLAWAADLFADLPELLAAGLADPNAEVRQVASRELILSRWQAAGTTWPSGVDPVPVLRVLLGAADAEVRGLALSDLHFNPQLVPFMLPELLGLLAHDPASNVRGRVLYALTPDRADVEPDPALRTSEVQSALRRALRDEDGDVRCSAFSALTGLWNPLPAELVPDLLDLARAGSEPSSSWALSELVGRDDCPAEVLYLLLQRLAQQDFSVQIYALSGLEQIGWTPDPDNLPRLLEIVQGGSESHRDYAIRLLGRAGPNVVPLLVPLLADDRPGRSLASVANALQTIGPAARMALPALARIVADPDRWEASEAVPAIAVIAEPAEVIELLRPAFRNRTGGVRSAVLEVASRFGPAARPWLEELLHLTRTDGETEAILAVLVRADPALLPRITALLDEPDPARSTAQKILAVIGA